MTNAAQTERRVVVEAVAKDYDGVRAVRDVGFSAGAGECLALVGHNGAGKTTLIKLMLGLIRPTAGTMTVLGENPATGSPSLRRQIGFLPESVAFNSSLTGRELLAFYARLKDQPRTEVARLLDLVGLDDAAARRVGTYSKGMRQRLGLAQSLLGGPRLLLLDEPTSGLDPALRSHFYKIIRDLCRSGTTVIISSHALAELESFADRVLILDRGHLVANGSIDELRRLACLPVRIRVHAGGATPPEWLMRESRRCGAGWHEVSCAAADKLAMIRRLSAACGVDDIEVDVPSLDQLYAHFLSRRGTA